MAARNSLVEDIRELFEAGEVDEVVRFNPKAPAGVKEDPKKTRQGQVDAIKAMRDRLKTGKRKDAKGREVDTTDDEKESDKFRLGAAYKAAGAKRRASELGHDTDAPKKKEPEHKEPEHSKHARDAEAASADAHDSHELAHQSADDAFAAMHGHKTAIDKHMTAMAAAKKAGAHASVQHHQAHIIKHAKKGKEAQGWFQSHSHDDEKKKAANEWNDYFDRVVGDPMLEQRRLMGFYSEPVVERKAEGTVADMMSKIMRSSSYEQRDLMGLENPYPTLEESRMVSSNAVGAGQHPALDEMASVDELKLGVAGRMGGDAPMEPEDPKKKKEMPTWLKRKLPGKQGQEEAVKLSTSEDPEHREKVAKAVKALKKSPTIKKDIAAFFSRRGR